MDHLRIHEQREGRDMKWTLRFGMAVSAVGLLLVVALGVYMTVYYPVTERRVASYPPPSDTYVVRDAGTGKVLYTVEKEIK